MTAATPATCAAPPISVSTPMLISVDDVLRKRLPRHYGRLPRWLVRWLERVVCQEQMNDMLRLTAGLRGADFCRAVLGHLGITYEVTGRPLPSDRRVTIVCNHPLGGLDGIAMIDWVTRVYGPGMKFVVNDLLMAIEPLSDVFLPVNKHGAQSRRALAGIDSAFAADAPVVVFPAGLVSRRRQGRVADLAWHKMFVNKSIAAGRTVIPVHFSGENSKFFYTFANLRERLGIRLNIEMVRLPAEVFAKRGARFTITVGEPVEPGRLRGGSLAQTTADELRRTVYSLAP